jgi:hypothetical protein
VLTKNQFATSAGYCHEQLALRLLLVHGAGKFYYDADSKTIVGKLKPMK